MVEAMFMARHGALAMSAIWPLTGTKQTWHEKVSSVAIEPELPSAYSSDSHSMKYKSPDDTGLDFA
jgi:hypothetical protein